MHLNNTTPRFGHIKFILWTGLIFAVFFLCSGCRAIFIPVDQIHTLSSRKACRPAPANIRVANFSQIGYGHIQAINPKQSVLLVTNASAVPPVAYTVNLLNPQNGSNQNFITSDKRATATVFQGDGKGVYYLNTQNTASSGSRRYQLVWSSLNRALTKVLSLPGESVQPALCATDKTHLLYADQSGHLVVIDSHQNRRVFNLSRSLTISKIYCDPQTHRLFFLGQKKNDDTPTLYTTVLENHPRAKKQPLKLQIIDHKVTDFDWMNQDHRLVYLRTMDRQRQIKTYSSKTLQIKKITTGYFYRITALKRNAVIVSQGYGSTFSNAATLRYIDLNTKQQKQLTSPLRLSSSVFSQQKKKSGTLFFSVEIPDKSNHGNEAIYRIDLK